MESQKLTARFTAPRDVRIVSPSGSKCMNFEAGQTRLVHKDLWSAAITAGLMPEESLQEETAQAQAAPVVPENKSQEEIVSEGLLEACKTLIARGNPNDFTQLGQPRAASVKKLVDFDFTANDVRRAFEQAMFEVESDGDDGTEHSESGSGTSE